ncbi:MAG: NgoMIV family type II restriction endonuclease [Terracidiphilus sp.]
MMTRSHVFFKEARRSYHAALLENVLRQNDEGVPSNADGSQKSSVRYAQGILERLGPEVTGARLAGQMAGNEFEAVTCAFLDQTFRKLSHIRPGKWDIHRVASRGGSALSEFEQYSHLFALKLAASENPELAAALGNEYTITPDIVIVRNPEVDAILNNPTMLMDLSVVQRASLRANNGGKPLLHASISCKWTLRSDRAQNARSEALNLIRNRKGRLPHIVVVTGEPSPSRLASIAIGTGDIDCIYHFALNELLETIEECGSDDAKELMSTMTNGKRLRDISDLPLVLQYKRLSMADRLSPAQRSENMRRIASKGTKPEMFVRRFVHSQGYRFRLHINSLPGKPDLVFPMLHKVIYVHGCFWHLHKGCREGRIPQTRRDYWETKLLGNVERDKKHFKDLRKLGWKHLIVWECEMRNPERVQNKLIRFLAG